MRLTTGATIHVRCLARSPTNRPLGRQAEARAVGEEAADGTQQPRSLTDQAARLRACAVYGRSLTGSSSKANGWSTRSAGTRATVRQPARTQPHANRWSGRCLAPPTPLKAVDLQSPRRALPRDADALITRARAVARCGVCRKSGGHARPWLWAPSGREPSLAAGEAPDPPHPHTLGTMDVNRRPWLSALAYRQSPVLTHH